MPLSGVGGDATRMLVLKEFTHTLALPADWAARLTSRQREVTAAVLRGWDNKLIGKELTLAETTVKRHLQDIFDRLGVDSRASLIARAAELQRGEWCL
jgi:DNA-binding NarL/FixJ family response regulator